MEDIVYTQESIRDSRINTQAYHLNLEVGIFEATLEMKAKGHPGILRVFFSFSDGQKIIALVYWWQQYLGFYEIPIGTKLFLTYERNARGTFLTGACVA